jgi:hypothetical protein
LAEITGFVSYSTFRETHKELGFRSKGWKVSEHDIGFQLREEHRTYNAEDDGKNEDTGSANASEWDVYFE